MSIVYPFVHFRASTCTSQGVPKKHSPDWFRNVRFCIALALLLIFPTLAGAQIATPEFQPPSALSSDTFSVIVTTITPGAVIRYTTDGIDPDETSPTVPSSGSVTIGSRLTLKARAYKTGLTPSAIGIQDYYVTGMFGPGGAHVLALKADGKLMAWGTQVDGRLGNGAATSVAIVSPTGAPAAPVQVQKQYKSGANTVTEPFENAVSCDGGYAFSLAVDASGGVWAFGYNAASQLGLNSTTSNSYAQKVLKADIPYASAAATDFLGSCMAVAAGNTHSLALASVAPYRVWAWGDRTFGKVGDGYASATASRQAFARTVMLDATHGLEGAAAIAAGDSFSLALLNLDSRSRGTVYAWGENSQGQLGQGLATPTVIAFATKVKVNASSYLSDVIEITAGADHAVVIREDDNGLRTVWSWGQQSYARLGNYVNTTTSVAKSYPVQVHGVTSLGADFMLDNVVKIATGPRHTLALRADHTVWAWGYNQDGNVGNGTVANQERAVQILLPAKPDGSQPKIVAIAAGGYDNAVGVNSYSLAEDEDGKFYGWGYNLHGEIANGTTSTLATTTPQLSTFTKTLVNLRPVTGLTVDPTSQPRTFALTATPSDSDGSIFGVNFYDNGTLLGSVGSTPFTLSTPSLSPGAHSFIAETVDNIGGTGFARRSAPGNYIVSLSVPVADTYEQSSPATFRFTRDGTGPALVVNYTIDNSSSHKATSGLDYAPLSGSITILAGQPWVDVPLVALGDMVIESDETVTLRLTPSTSYYQGSAVGVATIHDVPPTVWVTTSGPAHVAEVDDSNSGGAFIFYRNGSGSSLGPLTANYTIGGTANPGDYVSPLLTGTVHFDAGRDYAYVDVRLVADHLAESQETLVVTLQEGAGYVRGADTAATIYFEDDSPTFSIAYRSDAVESGSPLTPGQFTVTRSGSLRAMAINYTVAGSATPGVDYAALSGSVSFAQGQDTATITVNAIPDTEEETTESVIVTLNASPSYWLGSANSATVLIVDVPTCKPPTYYTAGGGHARPELLIAHSLTSGSAIHYTTNGQAPTESDPVLASDTLIRVYEFSQFWIRAFKSGFEPSVTAAVPLAPSGAIAAGNGFSIWLDESARMWSVGVNGNGQVVPYSPVLSRCWLDRLNAFSDYLLNEDTAVAAGQSGGVASVSSQHSWVWGQAAQDVGTDVGAGVAALAAGGRHFLALHQDGSVLTYGVNAYGLGTGSTVSSSGETLAIAPATAVACGKNHNLVVLQDGTVVSWGANESGQLGTGETQPHDLPNAPIAGLANIIAVAAGDAHSLALARDGTVFSWGTQGSVGYPVPPGADPTYTLLPHQVLGLPPVLAIAAGTSHSLAVALDGTVWAWGNNDYGQLGVGTRIGSATPLQVQGLAGVVRIAASSHSLAVTADGHLWGWGRNSHGEVGNVRLVDQLAPVDVTSYRDVMRDGWDRSIDTDQDGIPDFAESVLGTGVRNPDSDGDGLPDGLEMQYMDEGFNPQSPTDSVVDTDGDGLPDGWEILYGFNRRSLPGQNEAYEDPDGDGLTNLQEYQNGTNPLMWDTDGDWLSDGDEVARGLLPLKPDSDSDGATDGYEFYVSLTDPLYNDSDHDGMLDGWEIRYGLDPLQDDSGGDADRDGISNLAEFVAGSDPLDFYNGVHPTLTFVSEGTGIPWELMPVTVLVTMNGSPVANAPVMFGSPGGISLAPANWGASLVETRTNATGKATAYAFVRNAPDTTFVQVFAGTLLQLQLNQLGAAVTAEWVLSSEAGLARWSFDNVSDSGAVADESQLNPASTGVMSGGWRRRVSFLNSQETAIDVSGTQFLEAMDLDGVSGRMQVAANSRLELAQLPFSVLAWVQLPFGSTIDASACYPILSRTDGAGNYFVFALKGGAANGLSVEISNNGTSHELIAASDIDPTRPNPQLLADGLPHLVGLTRTAGGTATLYIDGAAVGSQQGFAWRLDFGSPLEVGAFTARGNYFRGMLDNITVMGSAPTAGEIAAYYDGDANGLPDWWEMKYTGHVGLDADGNQDFDGLSNANEARIGTNPLAGDTDRDGISDAQEVNLGTDPVDFFNGFTPTLTVVGGDRQFGWAGGGMLADNLRVLVRKGEEIMANAPVTFILSGSGRLELSNDTPVPSHSLTTVTVFSDDEGIAQVRADLAGSPGSHVTVLASSGGANPVEFTEYVHIRLVSWECEESSGRTLVDSSGNVFPVPAQLNTSVDRVDGALRFNGNGSATAALIFPQNTFTVSCMVQFEQPLALADTSRIQTILSVGSSQGAALLRFALRGGASNGLSLLLRSGGVDREVTANVNIDPSHTNAAILQDRRPHLIGVTRDLDDLVRLYIDGKIASEPVAVNGDANLGELIYLGSEAGGSNPLVALLDSIQILATPRSAADLHFEFDGTGNGLPDWWERKFGVSDPMADPDGDGLTNLQEYELGTNPVGVVPEIVENYGSEFPLIPHAMNDSGDIVGERYVSGTSRPFALFRVNRWPSTPTPSMELPLKDGFSEVSATAISNNGIVVGNALDANGVQHACLWMGGWTQPMALVDIPGAVSSTASGVNSNGDIIGTYTDAGGADHAFILHDGEVQILANLIENEVSVRPSVILDTGEIGAIVITNEDSPYHVVRIVGGVAVWTSLPYWNATVTGMNTLGQVSGLRAEAPGTSIATVWDNTGAVMTSREAAFEFASINAAGNTVDPSPPYTLVDNREQPLPEFLRFAKAVKIGPHNEHGGALGFGLYFYSPPRPIDGDGDGIPDDVETFWGLNPNDASDAKARIGGSGATALDMFKHRGNIENGRIQPVLAAGDTWSMGRRIVMEQVVNADGSFDVFWNTDTVPPEELLNIERQDVDSTWHIIATVPSGAGTYHGTP